MNTHRLQFVVNTGVPLRFRCTHSQLPSFPPSFQQRYPSVSHKCCWYDTQLSQQQWSLCKHRPRRVIVPASLYSAGEVHSSAQFVNQCGSVLREQCRFPLRTVVVPALLADAYRHLGDATTILRKFILVVFFYGIMVGAQDAMNRR